jgi:hypothetical protein
MNEKLSLLQEQIDLLADCIGQTKEESVAERTEIQNLKEQLIKG